MKNSVTNLINVVNGIASLMFEANIKDDERMNSIISSAALELRLKAAETSDERKSVIELINLTEKALRRLYALGDIYVRQAVVARNLFEASVKEVREEMKKVAC